MNTIRSEFLIVLIILSLALISGQLLESDRVREYNARKNEWPPRLDEYNPPSEGWRRIMWRRLEQISHIEDVEDRWGAYMIGIHVALKSKNFTQLGYRLDKAPLRIFEKLKKILDEAFVSYGSLDRFPEEVDTRAIQGDLVPKFITIGGEGYDILKELLPLHEAWAGVKLRPENAYGLRFYRNNTNLFMHIDNTKTHIISSILHVGRDRESDPWPLVLEDFEGNTNEVYLQPGDLLFYESSKCFHGRPKKFNGDWYTSLFLHYSPVDWDSKVGLCLFILL